MALRDMPVCKFLMSLMEGPRTPVDGQRSQVSPHSIELQLHSKREYVGKI